MADDVTEQAEGIDAASEKPEGADEQVQAETPAAAAAPEAPVQAETPAEGDVPEPKVGDRVVFIVSVLDANKDGKIEQQEHTSRMATVTAVHTPGLVNLMVDGIGEKTSVAYHAGESYKAETWRWPS
jgi:hypothetical protein